MEKIENFSAVNLRVLKRAAGFSRRELLLQLKELGVDMHANSLRRIEEGEQPMRVFEAVAFAKVFDVDLESFISEPLEPNTALIAANSRAYEASLGSVLISIQTARLQRTKLEHCIKEARNEGHSHYSELRDAEWFFSWTASVDTTLSEALEVFKREGWDMYEANGGLKKRNDGVTW